MAKQAAKSSIKKTKAPAPIQETQPKENKSDKLSNGYVKKKKGSNAEKTIDNTKNKRLADIKSGPSSTKEVSSSEKPLKRRAVSNVDEKESATSKTKTKKQKISYTPEICSVAGKVFVVGDNSVGQLGFDTEDVFEKTKVTLLEMPYEIVDIAAGAMHSVCLTQSGEVITFGCNDEGALGRETEDGTEYIPRKVELPEKIIKISAGDSHTAALSESGQVYLWGNFRNNNGPMGLMVEGVKQTVPNKILDNILKISSGSDHLICLNDEGNIFTCGNGEVGQLGRLSENWSARGGRQGMSLFLKPQPVPVPRNSQITDVFACSLATFLISSAGKVYSFGLNNFGQLGANPDTRVIWKPKQIQSFNGNEWKQINGGQHHTLALTNQGLVYSLGRNDYGRLGLGENCESTSNPTKIPSLEEQSVAQIDCGNCVSFAVTDSGSVYSWGFGTNYQLGHGNDNDQHVPKLVEGSFSRLKTLKVSSGGQHTLILAQETQTQKNKN